MGGSFCAICIRDIHGKPRMTRLDVDGPLYAVCTVCDTETVSSVPRPRSERLAAMAAQQHRRRLDAVASGKCGRCCIREASGGLYRCDRCREMDGVNVSRESP